MSLVFISYAREDREPALRLYRDLRQVGLEPWIDEENLLGGQDWQGVVGEAIRSSSYFLALISKHSVPKRGYVQREIHDALEVFRQVPPGQIYLVPIRLDETEPSHRELKNLHWINLFPSYPRGLRHLLKTLGVDDSKAVALTASLNENRATSVPAPEVLTVSRSHSERALPGAFSTLRTPLAAPVAETDDSDDCTYDENGICNNQKHLGANE